MTVWIACHYPLIGPIGGYQWQVAHVHNYILYYECMYVCKTEHGLDGLVAPDLEVVVRESICVIATMSTPPNSYILFPPRIKNSIQVIHLSPQPWSKQTWVSCLMAFLL